MAIKQQVPPEAYETLKQNPDALYLDVRTEGEFAAGHAAGAINIPVMVAKGPGQMQLNLDFVEVAEKVIPKGKKLVVGCMAGGRSQRACEMLEEAGFTDLTNVVGGFGGQRDAVRQGRRRGMERSGTAGHDRSRRRGLRRAESKGWSLMAIRLSRIYTRTGDKGQTALVGGKRVPKESARLEAYGTIDELNSIVGIVRTYLPQYRDGFGVDFDPYSESLRRIQNELFDVGSELATPPDGEYPQMHKMGAGEIKKLEEEMDAMEKELEPLKSFTLPGGGILNAFLHQARTVCRRAERVCWRLKREEDINDNLIIYVNRLSDHLFVQSRWVAKRLGEPEFLWDRALRIEEEEKTARAAKSKIESRREILSEENLLWPTLQKSIFDRRRSVRWRISFT